MNAPAYNPHDPDDVPLLGLTERRKADRERMAQLLQALAESHGASVERRPHDGRCPREITLCIAAPGGLSVVLDVDGNSCQPDVHVIPWHVRPSMPGPVPVRLTPNFGDVNPHHGQKATHVAYGFEALYWEIHRGLKAAADGTAYARGAV